jgi:hypothetical protein
MLWHLLPEEQLLDLVLGLELGAVNRSYSRSLNMKRTSLRAARNFNVSGPIKSRRN